ncbi:MAG: carbohydrate kinase [Bacteroidetes bacterium]|nr:carbohydrate kinase [Bacteroidota bacterium]
MHPFDSLFEQCKTLKVGVVGDVMLDAYMWGNTERISPEAPVPVVALNKKEYRLGGAGNVAWNLVAMGATAFIVSAVGSDENGEKLTALLQESAIKTDYLSISAGRITTTKTRIISRNQQMMRLDEEQTDELCPEAEALFIDQINSFIQKEQPDILIFEDYNKGVLTANVIKRTIELCKAAGILTASDPKRRNFLAYEGVDLFKPNLKEVREGLSLTEMDVSKASLMNMHDLLFQKMNHTISLITLSEKGIFYHDGSSSDIIPAHFRNIADVSGAGDTVIAVAALMQRISGNAKLAAGIANLAGGIVCESVGTVAIDRDRLLHTCKNLIVS